MSQSCGTVIRFGVASLAALFALVVTVTPALGAGGRPSPQSEAKEARKACLKGDYEKGVSILADLFVDTMQPIYVFNQGRCFEQNSRFKEAIAKFEEFMRIDETTKLDPADMASARKHIDDCKARLPKEPDTATNRALAEVPERAVQPLPPPVPQPTPEPQTSVQVVEQLKPSGERPRSRKALVIGGVVTGAVGLAAVGGGVAFNLKSNSLASQMETQVNGYSNSRDTDRKNFKTLAWVGYGVGAACIATGVVLIAVGASRRGSSAGTNIAFAPAIGPNQVGVVLSGGL